MTGKGAGRPSVDPAREVAVELLRAVREDDAYANLVLPAAIRQRGLTGRDAGFATELGYGTLRWQGLYDAILATCVTRPWDKVEYSLRDILRLGAHQLLAMRVPNHAAVDSSCELARVTGPGPGASGRAGFVNAVLRKVAARDLDQWVEELRNGRADDDTEWLAERWSHPVWMVRAFRDSLGQRRHELPDLLAADNEPARPSLIARPGRMLLPELLAEPGVTPGRWSPWAATLTEGTPDALDSVRDGRAGVQDEGSQLVALALARADVSGPDETWLDMCAGPGGKAALLDGLARERGARLIAVEQHPHRADLVVSSLPADTESEVIVGDSRERPWGDLRPDRVLLDAPCTGLGALRRRPESRWRRTTADLAALGGLQRDLLRVAVDSVRPGGVVAYVTCSPHLAETEFVVSDVLRGRTDVVVETAPALLPELSDCGDGPYVQMWPHRHGTDAMFLSVLRKV